jgi:anaerobic selenocysteine-containing dehydrogenase
MPVPGPHEAPERRYLEGGFPTPSGKMEFVSSLLERLGPGIGADALPAWRPAEDFAAAGPDQARDYPFILNAGSRLPMFVHSRTYRLSWTRGLRPRPAADISPADARALGVVQDDWIILSSPAGSIRVLANLTELAQPGVVHMYHGNPEADVNLLLDPDDLDPISGFPAYRSARCRIDKAPEEVTS